jgi:hypothetical protein
MIITFICIASVYYFGVILLNCFLPLLNNHPRHHHLHMVADKRTYFNPYLDLTQQLFDCTIISALLFLYRPRELPTHFNLKVDTQELHQFKTIPVREVSFDAKRSYNSMSSLGEEEEYALLVKPSKENGIG